MRFKDKVVLVTDSSRGIGKATAIAFAKEGARVVINHEGSDAQADNTLQELHKIGAEAITIKCDVSNETGVKNMVDQIIKKFGRIDILVNNAGIVFDVPFEKSTVENWKRTLDVNLIGTFLTTKYIAPHMAKNGGAIINISLLTALTVLVQTVWITTPQKPVS